MENSTRQRSAWPVGALFALALAAFGWAVANIFPLGLETGEYQELVRSPAGGWLARQVTANRVFPHWLRANSLFAEGQLEGSRQELEELLEIDPGHLQARMTLAGVLYQLNEHERVVAEATTVLESVPGFVPALRHRGLAAQALGDGVQAVQDYRTILDSTDPASEDYRLAVDALADIALEIGDLEGVLTALADLPEDGRDLRYFVRLGTALTGLGRSDDGLAAFQQARLLAPAADAAAETGLAESARASGETELARTAYVSALDLVDDDVPILRALASLDYNDGRLDQAEGWLARIPGSEQSLDDIEFSANLRFEQRRYESAAREYLRALGLSRNDDDRYRLLMAAGNAFALGARHSDAADAFRTAVRVRGDESAFGALAQTLESGGDLAGSLAALERLDAVRPSAQTRYRIADLHFRLANFGMATESYELAIARSLDPATEGEARRQRGYAYLALGAHGMARDSLEEALEFFPPTSADYEQLIEVSLQAGDDAGAIQYLRRAADLTPTTATLRRIVTLHLRGGDVDSAISTLEELRGLVIGDVGSNVSTIVEIANLEFERGNYIAAAERYLAAFNRRPAAAHENGARAATAFARSDVAWDRAVEVDTRLLETDGVPDGARAQAYERLGFALARLGEHEQAAGALEGAIALGRDDWETRQNAGFMWSNVGRWEAALPHFQASLDLNRSAQALRDVGLAYQQTGKLGLGLYYLDLAVREDPGGRTIPLKATLDQLGYGYVLTHQYARALEAWQRSLGLEDDPAIRVDLSRAQRLAGQLEDAGATLDAVAVEELPRELRVELLKELAELARAQDDLELGTELLRQAAMLTADVELHFRLGRDYRVLGDLESARDHLELAYAQEPQNDLYAIELGYTHVDLGNNERAVELFDVVLAREPDHLRVYGDLGFLHVQRLDNAAGVLRFRQAIDNTRLQVFLPEAEQQELVEERQRLRRTVTLVDKDLRGVLYIAPRSDSLSQITVPGGLAGGVIPSQGGAAVGWRPPTLGFRDGRVFEVVGRTLWNFELNSLRLDDESIQAGLGVRYKPFKEQSLFLSTERLFKIGSLAENNLLLRGSYSWDYGFNRPSLSAHWWDYTTLYADVGYFLQRPERWVGYLEGRQGVSVNVGDRLVLTPHLVVDGRYENPTTFISSYVEGGLGLSLKYLFGGNDYELHRSSLELLLHYKWGSFIESDLGLAPGSFRGWVVTPVLSF